MFVPHVITPLSISRGAATFSEREGALPHQFISSGVMFTKVKVHRGGGDLDEF